MSEATVTASANPVTTSGTLYYTPVPKVQCENCQKWSQCGTNQIYCQNTCTDIPGKDSAEVLSEDCTSECYGDAVDDKGVPICQNGTLNNYQVDKCIHNTSGGPYAWCIPDKACVDINNVPSSSNCRGLSEANQGNCISTHKTKDGKFTCLQQSVPAYKCENILKEGICHVVNDFVPSVCKSLCSLSCLDAGAEKKSSSGGSSFTSIYCKDDTLTECEKQCEKMLVLPNFDIPAQVAKNSEGMEKNTAVLSKNSPILSSNTHSIAELQNELMRLKYHT